MSEVRRESEIESMFRVHGVIGAWAASDPFTPGIIVGVNEKRPDLVRITMADGARSGGPLGLCVKPAVAREIATALAIAALRAEEGGGAP